MANTGNVKKVAIRWAIISLTCCFMFLIGLIFFKGDGPMRSYKAVMQENMLSMQGMRILYLTDDNDYVTLFAESSFANINNNFVDMKNVKIQYTGKDIKIEAVADNGKYELERFVNVYGNVRGDINNMRFDAGKDGTLVYDYKEGKGEVRKGISFFQGENSIKANMVNFDIKDNFILFNGNVSVNYYIDTKQVKP